METISWEDRDGARWIELEGELDNEGVGTVRDRFFGAVKSGEGEVIVRMNGVTFLSSMAVGLLLKARDELHNQDRKLKLSGMTESLRRVLEMMQLTGVFEEV